MFGLDSNEIAVRRLIRANISPTPTLFVYKLFRISFNQFGLQKKLEEFIEAVRFVELYKRVDSWNVPAGTERRLEENVYEGC